MSALRAADRGPTSARCGNFLVGWDGKKKKEKKEGKEREGKESKVKED